MKTQNAGTGNWLTADEYLKKYVDYSAMGVCRDCLEVYGPWQYKQDIYGISNVMLWQFCDRACPTLNKKPGVPPEESAEKKWPGFDFKGRMDCIELEPHCHVSSGNY